MNIHQMIVPSNPTPNGDVHIGHIAGPFLGADVLRRGALQRGEPASVLLGTAWQNTHVMLAAQRARLPYLDLAASFGAQIEASFASAGIGYDVMLRHGDIPAITQATRLAYDKLRADSSVVLRPARAQFCPSPGCDGWRFQGFTAGRCPHCGSADAAGIDCEGCGIYHDDSELLGARCSLCGESTVARALVRAFLELEPLRGWFEEYFGTVVMDPGVRRFAQDVLSRPLPSVAVTYPGTLGIGAQDPELPGQLVYPAFELAPRYAVMADRYRRSAGAVPGSTRTTMLFGSDNAFERIFLFPAVLRAVASDGVALPDVMRMSYFYLLDGLKFSTSRNHLVGVRDLVGEVGADTVRLYLAATRPEEGPSEFRRDEFLGSAQAAAVRTLTHWARSGSAPATAQALPENGGLRELAEASRMLHEALLPDTLSCTRAARAVLQLTALAAAPRAGEHLQSEVLKEGVLHALVNGAGALIPDTARHLREAFAVPEAPFDGKSFRPSALVRPCALVRS